MVLDINIEDHGEELKNNQNLERLILKMHMQTEISLDGGPLTEGFTLFTIAKKQ